MKDILGETTHCPEVDRPLLKRVRWFGTTRNRA